MQRRDFVFAAFPSLCALPLLGQAFASGTTRPTAAPGFVVRAGQSRFGVPTPFRGLNPNDLKLSGHDTSGALALFDYVGLEQVGPSLHRHLAQDEVFYVAEGEFLFQLSEQKLLLQAGDTVFLPRQLPHTWVQRSARGQLLYWLLPAGRLEEFFVYMSRQQAPLTPEALARVNAEHGLQNLGPGLSPTESYPLSAGFDAGFVVRAGTARLPHDLTQFGASTNRLAIAAHDTGGTFSLFEYSSSERGGPPLHVHPHQDELFYVLRGDYRFRVGDAQHILTTGDFIFLPRNVPHTFAQLSAAGRLLYGFQPAGRMEAFFRAAAAFRTPPTPAQAAALFAEHDMRVVGPPLAVR